MSRFSNTLRFGIILLGLFCTIPAHAAMQTASITCPFMQAPYCLPTSPERRLAETYPSASDLVGYYQRCRTAYRRQPKTSRIPAGPLSTLVCGCTAAALGATPGEWHMLRTPEAANVGKVQLHHQVALCVSTLSTRWQAMAPLRYDAIERNTGYLQLPAHARHLLAADQQVISKAVRMLRLRQEPLAQPHSGGAPRFLTVGLCYYNVAFPVMAGEPAIPRVQCEPSRLRALVTEAIGDTRLIQPKGVDSLTGSVYIQTPVPHGP